MGKAIILNKNAILYLVNGDVYLNDKAASSMN